MYDVIDTYFDDENVYPDFDQRIDYFFRDFVPGYLQEILDGLNDMAKIFNLDYLTSIFL